MLFLIEARSGRREESRVANEKKLRRRNRAHLACCLVSFYLQTSLLRREFPLSPLDFARESSSGDGEASLRVVFEPNEGSGLEAKSRQLLSFAELTFLLILF